jgi:hypothetical protein
MLTWLAIGYAVVMLGISQMPNARRRMPFLITANMVAITLLVAIGDQDRWEGGTVTGAFSASVLIILISAWVVMCWDD